MDGDAQDEQVDGAVVWERRGAHQRRSGHWSTEDDGSVSPREDVHCDEKLGGEEGAEPEHGEGDSCDHERESVEVGQDDDEREQGDGDHRGDVGSTVKWASDSLLGALELPEADEVARDDEIVSLCAQTLDREQRVHQATRAMMRWTNVDADAKTRLMRQLLQLRHAYLEQVLSVVQEELGSGILDSMPDDARWRVVQEIVHTERDYVANLATLCAMRDELRSCRVVSETQVDRIFSNLDVICAFHAQLKENVEAKWRRWDHTRATIGDVFRKVAPFLKICTVYTNNYDNALQEIDAIHKKKSGAQVLRQLQSRWGQPLESYLIRPIQRIPRYQLLLKELSSVTPEEHPDAPLVRTALEAIRDVAANVNESLRAYETLNALLGIESEVIECPSIVEKDRKPIASVVLREKVAVGKKSTPVRMIVMNDMFLLCSKVVNGWKYKCSVPFDYVFVRPLVPSPASRRFEFEVCTDTVVYRFVATSQAKKEHLVDMLRDCVGRLCSQRIDLMNARRLITLLPLHQPHGGIIRAYSFEAVVFHMGNRIMQWTGSKCHPMARYRAIYFGQQLAAVGDTVLSFAELGWDTEDPTLWGALRASLDDLPSDAPSDAPPNNPHKGFCLHRLDSADHCEVVDISQGLSRRFLDSGCAYVLDALHDLFVWVGLAVRPSTREAAIRRAESVSMGRTVMQVPDAGEPIAFTALFADWPDVPWNWLATQPSDAALMSGPPSDVSRSHIVPSGARSPRGTMVADDGAGEDEIDLLYEASPEGDFMQPSKVSWDGSDAGGMLGRVRRAKSHVSAKVRNLVRRKQSVDGDPRATLLPKVPQKPRHKRLRSRSGRTSPLHHAPTMEGTGLDVDDVDRRLSRAVIQRHSVLVESVPWTLGGGHSVDQLLGPQAVSAVAVANVAKACMSPTSSPLTVPLRAHSPLPHTASSAPSALSGALLPKPPLPKPQRATKEKALPSPPRRPPKPPRPTPVQARAQGDGAQVCGSASPSPPHPVPPSARDQ